MICSTLISEYLLVKQVSLLAKTSFRISSEFNYTKNITTKSINLIKIPPSTPTPLTFNRSDKVLTSIKLTKPIGVYLECNKPSILVQSSKYLSTFSSEKHFFTYNHGANIEIVVTLEITQTDEKLKKLKPGNRNCYFENENSLRNILRKTVRLNVLQIKQWNDAAVLTLHNHLQM